MPVPTRPLSGSLSTTSTSASRSTTSGLSFINELITKDKALQRSKTLPLTPTQAIAARRSTSVTPKSDEITRCDKVSQASVALLQDYGAIKERMRQEILSQRHTVLIHSIYHTITGLQYSFHAAKECYALAHDIETWLERLPRPRVGAPPLELGVGLRVKVLADRFMRRTAKMADYFYRIFIRMDTIVKDYKAASSNFAPGDHHRQLTFLSQTLEHCLVQLITFWSKASQHMFPIYVYAKRYPHLPIPFSLSPSTSTDSEFLPITQMHLTPQTTRYKLDLFESAQGCRAAYGTFSLYLFKMDAQLLDEFPKLFMEARKLRSYYTR